MLDEFLQVAYQTQTRKQAQFELVGLMEGLPQVELRKLASGTPVAELYGHLDKTAYLEACSPDGAPKGFLEKFKGTPLFDQAVALEQQELQAEMTDMQKRQERRQQNATDDSLYDAKDRIRVQKRLLELELAKQELGAAGAPPVPGAAPAQGAGAPGEVPAEGIEAGAGGVVGKVAAAKFRFADSFGRELAHADHAKVAHAVRLEHIGVAAGAVLAKTANLGAIGTTLGGALKGLAANANVGKALSFAAKNPAAVGAGLGAAGGAIAGGPDHRLSGALGGAALGGAAGHMAPGMMTRMNRGAGVLDAAKGSAQQAAGQLRNAVAPPAGPAHGAMSAAPVKMPKPQYADPSVLHAAQPPGAQPLNAPNPMSFGAPSLKQRMMGLVG